MKRVFLITVLLLTVILLPLSARAGGSGETYGSVSKAGIDNILTSEYMPDENFRNAIAKLANTKYNRTTDTLSQDEAEGWTSVDVSKCSVKNLKGIEYFTNLEELHCYRNNLTTLDVTKNSALKSLSCFENQLTTLTTKNPKLKELKCYDNSLTTLDVSQDSALETLNCSQNQLKTLITKNPALKSLTCDKNNLSTLDITQDSALETLSCEKNSLTTLKTKNTALKTLNCSYNNLTTLDVTQDTALRVLICSNNKLSTLDVTKDTALGELNCSGNNLSALDVTQNTALVKLNCASNNLTKLITQSSTLYELDCSGNKLDALDVTKDTTLVKLNCASNNLTKLITKNSALVSLNCSNNKLATLDVSQDSALTSLDCSNQSTSITVEYSGGKVKADISSLVGEENIQKVSVDAGTYDTSTGIYTFAGIPDKNSTFTYKYLNGFKSSGVMPVTVTVVDITTSDATPVPNSDQVQELQEGENGKIKSLFFLSGGKKVKSVTVEYNTKETIKCDFKYKMGYSVSLQLSSNDSSVAEASFAGVKEIVLAAKKPGNCVITCKDNISGKKCTLKVKVKAAPIASIAICDSEYHLKKGETLNVGEKLNIQPVQAVTEPLKYTSSAKKIASVSKKGIIKAKKPGTATITVASKSKPWILATCIIYVDE